MKRAAAAVVFLLAACDGPEDRPDAAPSPADTIVEATASDGDSSATAAGDSIPLVLDGAGLRYFVAPASLRLIEFGTPAAEARAALDRIHGRPPASEGTNADCNAGYATWSDGLTAWFSNGRFAGWSLSGDSELTDAAGIGLGSTRAEIEVVYAVPIDTTSLGFEFNLGGMAGTLGSAEPAGVVTHMWAGVACIAR